MCTVYTQTVLFFAFLASGYGLRCHVGGVARSSLINIDRFDLIMECGTDVSYRCVRVEEFLLAMGLFQVSFTSGICANSTICDAPCESIAQLVTDKGRGEGVLNDIGFDLTNSMYTVESCNKICCDTDNCNINTIAKIQSQRLLRTLPTLTMPSTTVSQTKRDPTPPPTSEETQTVPSLNKPLRSVSTAGRTQSTARNDDKIPTTAKEMVHSSDNSTTKGIDPPLTNPASVETDPAAAATTTTTTTTNGNVIALSIKKVTVTMFALLSACLVVFM